MSICGWLVSGFAKWGAWRFFSPWFLASWARSRSSTNPTFYTDFSPLLDFSGSTGFGTWTIFVHLFWATCRFFSIFQLFWMLERFCLWILYTLFTLVLLRHQGGVFYYCGPSILYLPFVPLRQKGGVYVWFGLGLYFFIWSSDFCPRMAKGGVC